MTRKRVADFPLPSTGRGIEGEGWEWQIVSSIHAVLLPFSALTLTLSPLKGEREATGARRHW